jgi:hypothetical protein
MFNPFTDGAQFIELGYDCDGYYVRITNINANTRLNLGPNPATVAAMFKANDVRHFDYDDDLLANFDAHVVVIAALTLEDVN